jgi:hypothetical protein
MRRVFSCLHSCARGRLVFEPKAAVGVNTALLIQRAHHSQPNPTTLLSNASRVTRCWSLLSFLLYFGVL